MVTSTVQAVAENGELLSDEALLSFQQSGQVPQVFVVDVDDLSAVFTYQVVMGYFFFYLVVTAGRPQAGLFDQIELHQELQCPVHGGHVDVGELLLYPGADLLGGEMLPALAKDIPDQRALGGHPVTQFE